MQNQRRRLIRQRLRSYFSVFALIPVVLFCGILTIYISTSAWRDNRAELIATLMTAHDRLDKIFREAYQIGSSASEDEGILLQLNMQFESDERRYANELQLDNALIYIARYFDPEIRLYILGENGGQYKSGVLSFQDKDFRVEDWYRDICQSKNDIWFPIYHDSHVVKNVSGNFASFGVPMRSRATGRILGVALVEAAINSVIQGSFGSNYQVYLIAPNREMNIVDGYVELYENDVVMAFEDDRVKALGKADEQPDYIRNTLGAIKYWRPDFPESGFLNAGRYQLAYSYLSANNWILVYTARTANLYKTPIIIGLLLVLGILILSLLAVFAANAAARTVTLPILVLKDSVRLVREDNFDVVIQKRSNDEIGDLCDQFNKMVAHIKELMARIYEEQSSRRKYELRALQAQINPHFLYNTLDSMIWLVRMKRNDEATTMIAALATFFKSGLNKGRDAILLSQEIINVESYMTIQQFRYNTKLSYAAAIDPNLEDIEVPKLILQPLIENAIYHGIKEKQGQGKIRLTCEQLPDGVRIVVGDDGVGMSEQRLAQLRSRILSGKVSQKEGYGVTNVYERLGLFFFGKFDLTIDSRENQGTEVTIFIPKEKSPCIN